MKLIKEGHCIYCDQNVFPYREGEVKNKEVFDSEFAPKMIFWHTKCEENKNSHDATN